MGYSLAERLKHSWNVLVHRKDSSYTTNYEYASSSRPDRHVLLPSNAETIITAIYERIAIDVAAIDIHHARVDENGRFIEEIHSGLNHILNVEANLDQGARMFMQDLVLKMFDWGVVAVVPIDYEKDASNPLYRDTNNILTMRTGRITEWFPKDVRVELFDENKNDFIEIVVPKASVAIIENPFYAVMNQQQSIVKRLSRKLQLIDIVDEKIGSKKLNIVLQLPYAVKGESKEAHVKKRIHEIESALSESEYGITYVDSTEKIQTLGANITNNLFEQVEYYVKMLYSQLGLTEGILNGTAKEDEMVNYFNRTVDPILSTIVEEFDRRFIGKIAHTQGQTLVFYRDPFKLAPAEKLANIMDLYTRNEILSPNEARAIIGFKPSGDIRSDELRNRNISPSEYDMENPVYSEGMLDPNADSAIEDEPEEFENY